MAQVMERQWGTVKDFDKLSGRGIIVTDMGEQVAVRYAVIRGEGERALRPGERVSLEIEQKPSGLSAVSVMRQS
ncbi:MAG TPA: cold shock domain-containing protein [Aggregatilineales bacterium]|nr:cold shock domain-containing protein [Aggregatilineales bacterium]